LRHLSATDVLLQSAAAKIVGHVARHGIHVVLALILLKNG
jgi:hypothetical protein